MIQHIFAKCSAKTQVSHQHNIEIIKNFKKTPTYIQYKCALMIAYGGIYAHKKLGIGNILVYIHSNFTQSEYKKQQ